MTGVAFSKDILKNYHFVHVWDSITSGVKGFFINKENGHILKVKDRNMFFMDTDKLKEAGVKTLRGKERTEFLGKFKLKLNSKRELVKLP